MRTEALPLLGGNLGLDVAIFAAEHARPRGLAQAGAHEQVARRRRRPARCTARNTTPKDGFFLVQVSSRRGWGAYRLRWNLIAGQ